jgi:anti-anti-sigma regulatory factor
VIDSSSGPLRITVDDASGSLTLRLEGRVAGGVVEELRRTWSGLSSELGKRPLVIDLRDAIYIDAKGLAVLGEIHGKTNAKFQTDSPLTQYFAEQATKFHDSDGNSKGA